VASGNKPVIVVGGGLGGLSAALTLGLKGRKVHVIEQAAEIAPIGYGIQLGPNVFPVFDRLGVTDAVMQASHLPPTLRMSDALSGEELINFSPTSPQYRERFKHPYVVIHRADIHNILLDACKKIDGIELTVSTTVTGFSQDGGGVRVACEDGRDFEGAALIGADGIKSRIREHFVPGDTPKPNGYVAHRTLLDPADVPEGTPYMEEVVLWAGPGYHIVHYPLRHNTIFNVVAVFRQPDYVGDEEVPSHEEEVRAVYSDACPSLKALVAKMDLERRWVLADRNPIRHWCDGRAAMLGDAAHPTLQTLAQGACMAIEDADCLGEALEATEFDYERAFVLYQNNRVIRAARVQLTSRTLWEFYHKEGLARDVRNVEAREMTDEDFQNCVSWVWSGRQPLELASAGAGPG